MIMVRSRVIFATIFAVGIAMLVVTIDARRATAQDQPLTKADKTSGKSSRRDTSALDDELLKDLGPDLETDEMPGKEPGSKATADKETKPGQPGSLDQELLKGLEDGEDVGEPSEDDPLNRLSRQMRDVEALIARQQADADTL